MTWYNAAVITGDRATPACDPSTVMVPYGMGWYLLEYQRVMILPGAIKR